jgi:phage tail sheath protein FI
MFGSNRQLLSYRTPGVYFEWLDSSTSGIESSRTDVAGFVGIAARGPLHTPCKVESWTQFKTAFGNPISQAHLAYAVRGFFANGGRRCYVVRVADPVMARKASGYVMDPSDRAGIKPLLKLEAKYEGVWAHDLQVTTVLTSTSRLFLTLSLPDGTQESWPNLSLETRDRRYALTVLNDEASGSKLVTAYEPGDFPLPTKQRSDVDGVDADVAKMTGGSDGLTSLQPIHLSGDGYGVPLNATWGLAALETVDEVSIVAMPDIMPVLDHPAYVPRPIRIRCDQVNELGEAIDWSTVYPYSVDNPSFAIDYPPYFDRDERLRLQRALVAHCEKLKDRVAILDPMPEDTTPEALLDTWRDEFSTSYAAIYFPYLQVPCGSKLEGGLLRTVPPSGHVAGVYARTDLRVGVHKPPANERLEDVNDLASGVAMDDTIHSTLNDEGINVIRQYPGRGIRIAGARTLARVSQDATLGSDPALRYVNVRRLLIMIEEAFDERMQQAVFEPHNVRLQRDLDRIARSYLDSLWYRGMLDGATRDDAYSVVCDETVNTPQTADLGQFICLIGIQPPWPAEFVIVRIGRTEAGSQIGEGRAALNG